MFTMAALMDVTTLWSSSGRMNTANGTDWKHYCSYNAYPYNEGGIDGEEFTLSERLCVKLDVGSVAVTFVY